MTKQTDARSLLSTTRPPVRTVSITLLLILALLPSTIHAATTALPAVTVADGRFGLCDVLPGAPPGSTGQSWGQLAYNAGARLDRWEFRWDQIEPADGTQDFTATDQAVQAATAAGLQVEGILIGTPVWAVASGQNAGNGVPAGLYKAYTDPGNLWAEYVRATVSQYQGEVHSWEIWNEPDIKYFWSGSPADYVQLLKVAYLTIKSIDKNATVLMGGLVDPGMTFATQVLTGASAAHAPLFDAVAWHAYGPAPAVYTNLMTLRSLLGRKGFGSVPIWVTEDGFPASNPNGGPRQAAYVLQTIAYALAAGAAKVLIYRASDDTTSKEWGLMAANGAPRSGYVAFQVAATYFNGIQAGAYDPTADGEEISLYGALRRVLVIWTHGTVDRSVQIPADTPQATLVDWAGNSTTIQAKNGQFNLTLPGAGYNAGIDPSGTVVGGPPEILVEDEPAAATTSSALHLPPLGGTQRRLLVFNPSPTSVVVQVSPDNNPTERATTVLPARSLAKVDLDLLAGTNYAGFYNVASSAPVQATAYSSTGLVRGVPASPLWYAPGASAVTVGSTSRTPISVNLTVFGRQGRQRLQTALHVPPLGRITWSVPPWLGHVPHAVSLQSSQPVPAAAIPGGSTTAPSATWYAIRPARSARLTVFNPDARLPAHLAIRRIGRRRTTWQHLTVAPHHVLVALARAGRAVVITASRPVVAGGSSGSGPGGTARMAATQANIPVAGAQAVLAFNPAARYAHITATFLAPGRGTSRHIVLGPGHVGTLRAPAGGPSTLVVHSDVPLALTPQV